MEGNHTGMPKTGECGYFVMQALADKIKDPNADINVGKKQAQKAKASVLWGAKELWETDATAFQMLIGTEYDAYMAKMISSPSTFNWKELTEGRFFTDKIPNLEMCTIWDNGKGETKVTSSRPEGEAPRE